MHKWSAVCIVVLLALASFPARAQDVTHIGSFSVVEGDPHTIYLEGEIVHGSAPDFQRALKLRPKARVLALSSIGGFIDDALVIAHEVKEQRLSTYVPRGHGCYSACAYIYFAGADRQVAGELGVHQVSGEDVDAVGAQTALSDVLDALADFDVDQQIVSRMLRTPPDSMYVFTARELDAWHIVRGNSPEFARLEVAYGAPLPEKAPTPGCSTIESRVIDLTACVADEWLPIEPVEAAQEFSYTTEDENFGLMVITEREVVGPRQFRAAIIENAVVGSGEPRESIKVVGERVATVGGRPFDVISYTIPNSGKPILFQNFYYSSASFGSVQILAYSLATDGWTAAVKAELFNATVRLDD